MTKNQKANNEKIAIIGRGCIFPPDSGSLVSYWDNMLEGAQGIRVSPPNRWRPELYTSEDRTVPDKTYCPYGGFVDDSAIDLENELPKSLSPSQSRVVANANRNQRMAIKAGFQALNEARLSPSSPSVRSGSLYLGNMLGDEALADKSLFHEAESIASELKPILDASTRKRFLENVASFAPNAGAEPESTLASGIAPMVAKALGIEGPSLLVDGACASGLLVIDVAIRALRQGKTSLAVVVGAMGNMGVAGNVSFAKIGGLSEESSCPLSEESDGLIPGEGAGVVILKTLSDARRDGDPIYGLITGAATSADGKGKSIYAPDSRGQEAAMIAALDQAGLAPGEIDKIELHATGTPTGDATEVNSVANVFGDRSTDKRLVIGTGKSLIGHTFAAAGMANLIKVTLEIEKKEYLPSHHALPLIPALSSRDEKFEVNQELTPWARSAGRPRRAMANAFGFGGVNSSVVIEEYDPSSSVSPSAQMSGDGYGRVNSHKRLAVIGMSAAIPSGKPGMNEFSLPLELHGDRKVEIEFPYRKFLLPPVTVSHMDRAQQLILILAANALGDSNLLQDDKLTEPSRLAAIIGAAAGLDASLQRNLRIRKVELLESLKAAANESSLAHGLMEEALSQISESVDSSVSATTEASLPGYMDNIIAGRLANNLDARGFNCTVDQDFASFGASLDIAYGLLSDGSCDFALVGATSTGVNELNERIWSEQLGIPVRLVEGAAAFVVTLPENLPEGQATYGYIDIESAQSTSRESLFEEEQVTAVAADDALWAVAQLADVNLKAEKRSSSSAISGWGYTLEITRVPTESTAGECSGGEVAAEDPKDDYLTVRAESVDALLKLLEGLGEDSPTGMTEVGNGPIALVLDLKHAQDPLQTLKRIHSTIQTTTA